MSTCRHCSKDIRYRSARGWYHVQTGSQICAIPAKHVAEPKR